MMTGDQRRVIYEVLATTTDRDNFISDSETTGEKWSYGGKEEDYNRQKRCAEIVLQSLIWRRITRRYSHSWNGKNGKVGKVKCPYLIEKVSIVTKKTNLRVQKWTSNRKSSRLY